MVAEIFSSVVIPEPFPSRVGAVAQLTIDDRPHTAAELAELLRQHPADVFCPRIEEQVSAAVLEAGLPRLRCVSLYSVGYNHVDIEAATSLGIAVGNTPGVLTDATADCAMGLLLGLRRRLCEGDALVRRGGFSGWTSDFMLGHDLAGASLGIIGMGRIGQAMARRALAFGMRIYCSPRHRLALSEDLAAQVTELPFDELVAAMDVISLHVPLNTSTHHLINADVLRRMKPTAILINTARGPVIDEAALVIALKEGWIAGAGLDVYEDEPRLAPGLLDCANTMLTPHLGSATVETRSAMARLCAENVLAAVEGKHLPHCVNPQAWEGAVPPSLT